MMRNDSARGVGKRRACKKIRRYCNKSVMAWSIEASRQSRCFECSIVSREDAEIAEVTRSHCAKVPFIRPYELSEDRTHAIDWMSHQVGGVEAVCFVHNHAFFKQTFSPPCGLGLLQQSGADCALSISNYAFPSRRGPGSESMRMMGHRGIQDINLQEDLPRAGWLIKVMQDQTGTEPR